MKNVAVLVCALMLVVSAAYAEEYSGAAEGRNGDVHVSVVYEDGKISAVKVGAHQETPGISDPAIAEIPARIVKEQSLTVDVVSGATLTSAAIIKAAERALAGAGVDVSAFKKVHEAVLTEGETENVDIVIVGAGMAGLMAAYELKENYPGIKYLIIDKLDYVSGSVPTSGGAMASISSRLHKASGTECTVQDFVDLFEYTSGQKINEALVKNVYAKSDVTMNRLLDYGAKFDEKPQLSSIYSDKVYAFWSVGGGAGMGRFVNNPTPKSRGFQ